MEYDELKESLDSIAAVLDESLESIAIHLYKIRKYLKKSTKYLDSIAYNSTVIASNTICKHQYRAIYNPDRNLSPPVDSKGNYIVECPDCKKVFKDEIINISELPKQDHGKE